MSTKYGLAEADWDAVKAEMRLILIGLARLRQTICYSDLAAQLQTVYLHHRAPAFSRLLVELGTEEEAAGLPVLATLVVNKQTGLPGGGYFKHSAVSGSDVSDIRAYWEQEFEHVCDYWAEKTP